MIFRKLIGQVRQTVGGLSGAYLCRNRSCDLPVTSAQALTNERPNAVKLSQSHSSIIRVTAKNENRTFFMV